MHYAQLKQKNLTQNAEFYIEGFIFIEVYSKIDFVVFRSAVGYAHMHNIRRSM